MGQKKNIPRQIRDRKALKERRARSALEGLMVALVDGDEGAILAAMEQANTALGKLAVWDDFRELPVNDNLKRDINAVGGDVPDAVYLNSIYEVWCYREPLHGDYGDGPAPMIAHLSIKRRDKQPIDFNHWRELQRIKDAICGPSAEAVELFPSQRRLVDTSNQYHLYVQPPGAWWPVGYIERAVSSVSAIKNANGGVGRQRPVPEKLRPPDDAANQPVVEEAVAQMLQGNRVVIPGASKIALITIGKGKAVHRVKAWETDAGDNPTEVYCGKPVGDWHAIGDADLDRKPCGNCGKAQAREVVV